MIRWLAGGLAFLTLGPGLLQAQAPAIQDSAARAYLNRLLADNGGYRAALDPASPVTLRTTTSALRALRYFEGQPSRLDATREFILSCRDANSGGFADLPGREPAPLPTAVGVMAAAELKLPLDAFKKPVLAYLGAHARSDEEIRLAAAAVEILGDAPPQARDWLERTLKARNADGSFGAEGERIRATGGCVALVLRLGGKFDQPDRLAHLLREGQLPEGAFAAKKGQPGDLETTYRVLRSLYMLKAQPRSPENLKAFLARCQNPDGGFGTQPGQPSSVSGTYFAGIILHWLKTD